MKTTKQSIATLVYLDANENELKRTNVTLGYDLTDEQWAKKSQDRAEIELANCMINDCVEVRVL